MKLQVGRGHLLNNWTEILLFDLPAISTVTDAGFLKVPFSFCLVRPQVENMFQELSW